MFFIPIFHSPSRKDKENDIIGELFIRSALLKKKIEINSDKKFFNKRKNRKFKWIFKIILENEKFGVPELPKILYMNSRVHQFFLVYGLKFTLNSIKYNSKKH